MVRRERKRRNERVGAPMGYERKQEGLKNDSFDYYVPAHVDFYGIEDFSLPSCS